MLIVPTATQALYAAAGHSLPPNSLGGTFAVGDETCWLCGGTAGDPVPLSAFVKDTFTDFDKARPGSSLVCAACAWSFSDRNPDLTRLTCRDKPQRMRNYSHIVKSGEWFPLSKAQKDVMRTLLLELPFPELAVIAESGQKHLVFRARLNPPGQTAGWVQVEEQALWIDQAALALMVDACMALLEMQFSKAEIAAGDYQARRILRAGYTAWAGIETLARGYRRSSAWPLAVFLSTAVAAEKESDDDG